MNPPARVRSLFEAHLAVANLGRSLAFYRDTLGLELAATVPERGAAFLWLGERGRSMLGLWSLGSMPMGVRLHLAFEVALADLLAAPARLRSLGVAPEDFFGAPGDEPSVLAWMPAAAIYFRDPDGHLLEYLSMLDQEPRPELGVLPWSAWNA